LGGWVGRLDFPRGAGCLTMWSLGTCVCPCAGLTAPGWRRQVGLRNPTVISFAEGRRSGGSGGLRSLSVGSGQEDELVKALESVKERLSGRSGIEDELAALQETLEALKGIHGKKRNEILHDHQQEYTVEGPSVPVDAAAEGSTANGRVGWTTQQVDDQGARGDAESESAMLARVRETRVGRRRNSGTRARMSEAQVKRWARAREEAETTKDATKEAREAKSSKPVGASARRKMRKAKLAYHREHGYPEGTRKAIVAYHTGREKSAEARAKTSATMKAYWDRRRVAEGKMPRHDASLHKDADEAKVRAEVLDLVPDFSGHRDVSLVDAEAMAARAVRPLGMTLNHKGGLSCDLHGGAQVLTRIVEACAKARDADGEEGDTRWAMKRCADESEALGEQLGEVTRELKLWADAFEVLEGGVRPCLADLWETERRNQGLVDRFAKLAELSDRMACVRVAAVIASVADEQAAMAAARGRAESTLQAARLRHAEARVVRDEEINAYATGAALKHANEGMWSDVPVASSSAKGSFDGDDDDVWGEGYGAMLRDFNAASKVQSKSKVKSVGKAEAPAVVSHGSSSTNGLLEWVHTRERECEEEVTWLWEAQQKLLEEWRNSGGVEIMPRPPMPVTSGESVSLSCDRVAGARVRVVRSESKKEAKVHTLEVVAELGVGRRAPGNGDWDLLWVLLPHEEIVEAHENAGLDLRPGHYFYAIPSHELSLRGFLKNAKRGSGKMRLKLRPSQFDRELPPRARNSLTHNLWANRYLFRYEDLAQPDGLRRAELLQLLDGERLAPLDR